MTFCFHSIISEQLLRSDDKTMKRYEFLLFPQVSSFIIPFEMANLTSAVRE